MLRSLSNKRNFVKSAFDRRNIVSLYNLTESYELKHPDPADYDKIERKLTELEKAHSLLINKIEKLEKSITLINRDSFLLENDIETLKAKTFPLKRNTTNNFVPINMVQMQSDWETIMDAKICTENDERKIFNFYLVLIYLIDHYGIKQ